jgi:hypothetical protein
MTAVDDEIVHVTGIADSELVQTSPRTHASEHRNKPFTAVPFDHRFAISAAIGTKDVGGT